MGTVWISTSVSGAAPAAGPVLPRPKMAAAPLAAPRMPAADAHARYPPPSFGRPTHAPAAFCAVASRLTPLCTSAALRLNASAPLCASSGGLLPAPAQYCTADADDNDVPPRGTIVHAQRGATRLALFKVA